MSYKDKLITFTTKDGKSLTTLYKNIELCQTIKNICNHPENEEEIEDWEVPQGEIPLNDVNYDVLNKVIAFCKFHSENKNINNDSEEYINWKKEYLDITDDELFNIILAANYLDVKTLLDMTCETVATYIKSCKTPQDIRRRFSIKNDFTPEEEEEVKKENAWYEDSN